MNWINRLTCKFKSKSSSCTGFELAPNYVFPNILTVINNPISHSDKLIMYASDCMHYEKPWLLWLESSNKTNDNEKLTWHPLKEHPKWDRFKEYKRIPYFIFRRSFNRILPGLLKKERFKPGKVKHALEINEYAIDAAITGFPWLLWQQSESKNQIDITQAVWDELISHPEWKPHIIYQRKNDVPKKGIRKYVGTKYTNNLKNKLEIDDELN